MKKIAIVTGARRGIGLAIAKKLLSDGYTALLCATAAPEEVKELLAELNRQGEAHYVRADISVPEDRETLLDYALEKFGRIDVLVNNAGVACKVRLNILEITPESFERLLRINCEGTFFMCRAAADALKKAHGVIINITSIAGVTGLGSSIAYAASKAAEISITKSLARVLAPEVRVIAVAPGIVLTRWVEGRTGHIDKLAGDTPLQKVAVPDDIAQTVYALIAHADFVTGQNIIVDGGAFI